MLDHQWILAWALIPAVVSLIGLAVTLGAKPKPNPTA
jgi:hypothetical protein